MMGRADYYSSGDYNAICSMCGFKFKASELRRHWQGMMRCAKCWEPRQPQDFVKAAPPEAPPPWVQPPNDTFTRTCTALTRSAIPGTAGPGCALPRFVVPGVYYQMSNATGLDAGGGGFDGEGPAPVPNPDPPPPPDPTPPIEPQIIGFASAAVPDVIPRLVSSFDGGLTWESDVLTNMNAGRVNWAAWNPNTSRMVAIHSIDGLMVSSDGGITWASVSNPFASGNPQYVFYSTLLSCFILIGGAGGTGTNTFIASSTDGENWTVASVTTSLPFSSYTAFETVGPGREIPVDEIVVIVSGTGVFHSVNLVDWTLESFAPLSVTSGFQPDRTAYSSSLGEENGRAMGGFSGTRATWSEYSSISKWQYWETTTGQTSNTGPKAWSESLGLFISAGGASSGSTSRNSANGISWVNGGALASATQFAAMWNAASGLFISAGAAGTGGNRIYTSSDGINWTVRNSGTHGITALVVVS